MTRTKTISAVFAAVLVVLASGAAVTLAASSMGGTGTNAAMQEETTTVAANETTVEADETTVAINETTTAEPVETTAVEETTVDDETATAVSEPTTEGEALESFNVSNLSAPVTANVTETITVNANVSNPNDQETTQPVEFRLDGVVVERQQVTLGAGESENVTFEVDTTGVSPGLHIHGVLTRDRGQLAQITILELAQTPTETTTAVEETPTEVEETPTEVEETPTEVEETPTEIEETPTEVEETPTEIEETPTEVEETPTEVEETPTEVEVTPEEPERVEQLVFTIEQLEIDEWSFIIGDSQTPDRTETVEDITISDRTQRINLTALLMEDGTIEDAMVNETDTETITTPDPSEAELPEDIETVRVVLRDISIENVTFIVELPSEAELPELPETPTVETPTEVAETPTEVEETPTEIEETPTEVGETPTEVEETPTEIEETPTEVGETTTAVEGTPTEVDGEPGELANVTFEDQDSDGTTVTVASVSVPEGGFVAMHDRTLVEEDDALGSVVGTSEYLEPGTHENVSVTLDEPLEDTQVLIAMPHQDTNDNQQYDFVESEGAEDGAYVDDEGEAVTDSGSVRIEEETETPTDGVDETPTEVDETPTEVGETPTEVDETPTEVDETPTEVDETPTDGVVGPGASSFNVSNLSAPETATVGDTVTVNATVSNPNDETARQEVDFRIEGDLVERQNVTLDAGQSQVVTFEVDTTGLAAGEYIHGVETDEFGELAVITLEEGVTETTEAVETTTETEVAETTEGDVVETTTEEDVVETTEDVVETTTDGAADGTATEEPVDGTEEDVVETTTEGEV